MSNDVRLLLVYALRAAAFTAAVYVLEFGGYPLGLAPRALQYVIVIAAAAVVATAFGVGSLRWPIATLLGAVTASFALPAVYDGPGLLLPLIWLSWFLGTLAKVVMLNSDLLVGVPAPDVGQPEEERPRD